MGVGIRKIAGDLRSSRSQAFLLFAAILVGQAIMTAAFMARSVIATEIERNYAMTKSPDVTIDANGVDGKDLADVEGIAGVGAIDTVTAIAGRYRLPDNGWRQIMLYGRRDFADQRVSKVFQRTGPWPPSLAQMLIERSGVGIAGKAPGDIVDINFGRGKTLALRYAGTVHDAAQAPSWQENTVYGYAPLETLIAAAGPRLVQYRIVLTADAVPATVAKAVSDVLVRKGGRITRVNLVPAVHPHADLMNGLLILLAIFSILSFVVAISLAASIVAGLAQRQERHIAVLRALGASRRKIGLMHFAFALTPAVPGLLLGAFAGQLGAGLLQSAVANQLNIELGGGPAPTSIRDALLVGGAIGVLVALFVPISAALRKTVREVLQSGLKQLRRPWLKLRAFSPMDRLAIAEVFQRPVKTAITVVALTLAGAALLSSTNAFASLVALVDRKSESRLDDIAVTLTDPPAQAVLSQEMSRVDGVRRYELWDRKLVSFSVDGASAGRLPLMNPPGGTQMGIPKLMAGRWPKGDGEIAVSQMAAAFNPPLQAAFDRKAPVLITVDGASTTARIVGLTDEWGPGAWTSPATFAAIARPEDRARELRAIVDPAKLAVAAPQIDAAIIAAGSFPLSGSTRDDRRTVMVNHFFSFYQFLLVAGLGAVIVGGIALSATIGSSVLDRVREIGVLKALGAQSQSLFRLVLVQALTTSLVSLLAAILLSWPLSLLMVRLLEDFGLHMDLPLKISWPALLALAGGSVVLAVAAAIAPAIRVKAIAIREAITAE
jgi:putative ABC transport system permease protein